jgi:inner membrane protein
MDTGTHIAMGIALGGIATLDPAAASGSITATAIMIGTITGSHAPDFDTVLKLKNNATYIRHHRGVTHSLPALLLWPSIITGLIYLFFPGINFLHVWLWTFLAVFLHVFVDIFNAYGTQALRPINKKWVALGIINTFDPFIFLAHLAAIFLWIYNGHPVQIFSTLYFTIFFYYVLRFYKKKQVIDLINQKIPDAKKIVISPTIYFSKWHVAVKTDDKFFVANVLKNELDILDKFKIEPIPDNPIMEAAFKDENLSAFLSFSPIYRWELDQYNDHYEVRFIDLRYRSNGYYPFVAVVQLDEDLNIVSSYTGWIFSEKKLMSKLLIAQD